MSIAMGVDYGVFFILRTPSHSAALESAAEELYSGVTRQANKEFLLSLDCVTV